MASQSDLERFAAAIRESEQRERAALRDRKRQADTARQVAADKAMRAAALERAERDVQRAIARVRAATESGRGRADADAEWRSAKAALIELQTGAPPAWARRTERASAQPDDALSAGGDTE
jgi:hypothetical protein